MSVTEIQVRQYRFAGLPVSGTNDHNNTACPKSASARDSTRGKRHISASQSVYISILSHQACEAALASETDYKHSQTEEWNSAIIVNNPSLPLPGTTTLTQPQRHILTSLISSQSTGSSTTPHYKYAVNSTIIQHSSDPSPTSTSSHTQTPLPDRTDALGANEASARDADTPINAGAGSVNRAAESDRGRRGMHSATGAFWNSETDGMWSWKYEHKVMEVVINVLWISTA